MYHVLMHNGKLSVDFHEHSQDETECLELGLASSGSWAGHPLIFIGSGFIETGSCPLDYGSSMADFVL